MDQFLRSWREEENVVAYGRKHWQLRKELGDSIGYVLNSLQLACRILHPNLSIDFRN